MSYKHESDPLFIRDKENGYKDFTVFESIDSLSLLHKFSNHSKSSFSYTVVGLWFSTLPLAKFVLCVCLIKNSTPQNPVGKKGRRKEYITRIAYAAPIASLKTLHEKT